jgi:excinuclease ABC subunit C
MITKEQIKLLPQTIGLYFFKNGEKYIYIGKSLNIRVRVHNHFERADFDAKERAIIENSDHIEHIICASELHALVLESQLIQKYLPPYNVIWKDNKSYLYIKIPIRDNFPRVSLVRREADGKSLYFGPYSSTRDVRFLLRAIRKVVPFCTQKQPIKKPCFYSKIGLCNPCPGQANEKINKSINEEMKVQMKKTYRTNIRKVIAILEGKAESILKDLKRQILIHSDAQEYEQSLELRNKLLHLEELIHLRSFERFEYSQAYDPEVAIEKLKTILLSLSSTNSDIPLSRIECYDISNLMQKEATASMVVATNGILDKAEYKRFKMKVQGVSDFKMLTEAITRRMNNEWKKPDLIVVDGGTPQVITISGVLKNLKVEIPLIGIAKRPDRIVVLVKGESKTYKFSLHNEGFKLIQQLRDESHRFAKKYHTMLRGKKFMKERT